MHNLKHILTTGCFCALLFGLPTIAFFSPDQASSEAERRPLAQLPDFSLNGALSGNYFTRLEEYLTDQFPARDEFRSLKAYVRLYGFHMAENNGLATADGYLAKINTELNTASLDYAAGKLHQIYTTYLAKANTQNYLAIIPDKGYFLARDFGYPTLDYAALCKNLTAALPEFAYIDLFAELTLADYYRTDTHWRQENLLPHAQRLAEAMGAQLLQADYTAQAHYPFNGVYAAQSALNPEPDTLYYLTNEILDKCTVFDYETGTTLPVYDLAKLDTAEPYDVFLSGTKALLRLDNPNAPTDRELVVFRDSYAASLVPLLAGSYRSITLVDLRYINPQILGDYIVFTNQDVLLLYSTLLLNDSFALK